MASKTGAPLNYSTTIDPVKSAAECTSILAMHGAKAISSTWHDGEPIGLRFVITTSFGDMAYTLPINTVATHKVLLAAVRKGKIQPRFATEEQAKRVAWRVLKDWIEIQLSLVEAGLAEFEQTMLAYMHVDGTEAEPVTMWDVVREHHGQLAIEG
jgi:hypothetical protein